ncbi:MAG: MiaB/RimO family radical SAM methylthiotransferase [Candidatus Omnitrophica bacterium]|nr:MiaB/RimO family radical SAM methylthiotransferase [Candidatus Omnitrophota bacterium]
MRLRIGILSLGCPRNLIDSESILSRLFRKGYKITDIDKAQVALVNTCAFIKEAKQESIDVILDLIDLKKEGKLQKIIVYGCLPERYKAKLAKELPEIDAFLGRISPDKDTERFSLTPAHYAYLKICEGCINLCSFCIIPKIKGRLVSLSVEAILNKVKEFDKKGISELNIIGQDITGFGLDLGSGVNLVYILKEILKNIKHIGWIRLLYLNPERIGEDLLKLIRNEDRICKYIDLPIQHINNRILKLMHRKSSRSEIVRLIDRVRKIIPGVALRTSIIVGFPGETEREFNELLGFIRDVKFERLGAFKYSREEGTPAYNFSGQVPEKIKSDRFNQIMSCQQEISKQVNSGFIGKELKILIDECAEGSYLGRAQFDAPEVDGLAYVRSKIKLMPGDFVNLKVTDTLEYDLVGEVQNESIK